MTLPIILVLLFAVAVYWFMTQVMPEQRKYSLLRPALADGFLERLNEQREAQGLPALEVDDDLMAVAENKATHQLLTGDDELGWNYPHSFEGMFGRSLLMETLLMGPATHITKRLANESDLFDREWLRCGPGVAGAQSPGQAVVALGNPLGLTYSVVSGVVSGIREVEGRPMIQLAIPIEPGNSGGPVVDMQGRVQGIITLKSALTANLGFAMPVNALKLLLEKPNPVAMSRWLTEFCTTSV